MHGLRTYKVANPVLVVRGFVHASWTNVVRLNILQWEEQTKTHGVLTSKF